MRITRPEGVGCKGFDEVFAYLRGRLLDGSIQPGDRLVAERELAAQLGVGRPVLREALRALAMLGVVETRQGMGTVVRRPDVSVLGEFFAFALAQQSDIVDDVIEARIAIECQAARLFCRRATEADHGRLRAALDRVVSTIDDPLAGGRADFAFHLCFVEGARSETLLKLHCAIADLLMRSHVERRGLVRVSPEMRDFLVADHRWVFDALLSRDERHADEVLRRHFTIGDEHRRLGAIAAACTAKDAAELQGRTA